MMTEFSFLGDHFTFSSTHKQECVQCSGLNFCFSLI